jgi:hypothetical protein
LRLSRDNARRTGGHLSEAKSVCWESV